MNKLGKWESEHYYLNYVWQTKDRTQQIALAPIPINKQGKFSVSHDVRASFETLYYLPDHFFFEAIAKQEIENWAKVINDTFDYKYVGFQGDTDSSIIRNHYYLASTLSQCTMKFDHGKTINVWQFNLVLGKE